jgi:hypothetical protein
VPAAASAHTGDRHARVDPPRIADLRVVTGPVRDGVLSAAVRRPAAGAAPSWWGGSYTTSTGEAVTIYTSEAYAVDQNANQTLANFFAGLVHGSELARLTVYVAPLALLQSMCGSDDVAGCYSSMLETMVVPGEDLAGGPTVAEVITHEYGHHIATNRINAPWLAVDWGTKRWASYLGVCAGEAASRFFPGDESADYDLNPGEGFAEAYRVLNQLRAGATSVTWPIVDDIFFPDQRALELITLDVTQPWLATTRTSIRGSFTATGPRTRRVTFATPLDGPLRVVLRSPPGARYRLDLLGPHGGVLGTGATISRTVCGERTFSARVTRVGRAGRFSLEVSKA